MPRKIIIKLPVKKMMALNSLLRDGDVMSGLEDRNIEMIPKIHKDDKDASVSMELYGYDRDIKYKTVNTTKQWSVLNKRVFQVIREKKIAYKHEIELFLELEGYQNWDVGRSLEYLSKFAPFIHLDTTTTKIDHNDTKFFFRKKGCR